MVLHRPVELAALIRHWETCRGSMQAISRGQTEKEISVVVGNSGCHDPAPIVACWPVHAQTPRVEPISRTKDKPSSREVRRCRCVALSRRICSRIAGPRGRRLRERRWRNTSRNDRNHSFNSFEWCDISGNWIDSLVFWGSIFQFLSKTLVKLALSSQSTGIPCPNVCQLLISRLTGQVPYHYPLVRFPR